jgi:hypothetical protein
MTPKKPEGEMWNSRTTHLHIEQTSPVDLWITLTLSTDDGCWVTYLLCKIQDEGEVFRGLNVGLEDRVLLHQDHFRCRESRIGTRPCRTPAP